MAVYGGAQAAPEQKGWLEYKWKVLICVIFGVFMIVLDSTVVNVALRTVQSAYNVSLSNAQWIVSVYVLALGIMTPMSGFLADRFGIKRMYVIGLAIFVFGSFLCGLAPSFSSSIWLLVAARALQGFGGGMAQPLAAAFIYSTFPPKEQGLALGFFGISLVVGPALGPILGGWLVDHSLWQWIFFINVPIGILGVTLATRWLRKRPVEGKTPADVLGLITSVIGFGAVLLAASEVSQKGWSSSFVLTTFGIGAVALFLFTMIELFVAKSPLLNLRLFGRPTFALASLIGWVSVIGLFGAEFLMPLYLQILRGRTALETGVTLLPLAISAAITTPIAGRLYDKIGPRPLVVTGFGLLLLNTWQLSHLTATTPISTILLLLALRGVALGLTVQTTFATALGAVPRNVLARGSSLVNGTRFVVQSIGVAALATVLTGGLSPATQSYQNAAAQQASGTQPVKVTNGAKPVAFGICETPGVAPEQNLPPGVPAGAAAQVRPKIQQACSEYVAGFEKTYRLTFYFAILAMLIGFLLPGWPLKWAGRGAAAAEAPPMPAH